MISTVVLSWKLADLAPLRLAVLEDRIEHHAEHADEDQQADDQDEVVQPLLLGGDACHRRMQVELVDRRTARQVRHRTRGGRSHASDRASSPACGAHWPARCNSAFVFFIMFSSGSDGASDGDARRLWIRTPQRGAQLVGQQAPQLGADEAADEDAPPLPGQLDQRVVARARLDPHPGRLELDPLARGRRRRARPSAHRGRAQSSRDRWHGAHTAASPHRPQSIRARQTTSRCARPAASTRSRPPARSGTARRTPPSIWRGASEQLRLSSQSMRHSPRGITGLAPETPAA